MKPQGQSDEVNKRIECTELLLQSQVLLGRGLKIEGAKVLEKKSEKKQLTATLLI
ncbi:hypothetical protein [Algoriphagus boritolerans]|uniref:hypothetical protein n=1 Tax=Algoriphagus boritolerans TaxID=308111 RepID=UPI000AF7DD72